MYTLKHTHTQHYASRNGHFKVCQLLITSGAGVNIQTPGGVTPLHRSSYCGHAEVTTLLLENGADAELVDSDGRTALHKVFYTIIGMMVMMLKCNLNQLVLLAGVTLLLFPHCVRTKITFHTIDPSCS